MRSLLMAFAGFIAGVFVTYLFVTSAVVQVRDITILPYDKTADSSSLQPAAKREDVSKVKSLESR